MVANNVMEIYSLIFAWHLYGVVWDVMVGTGIALIPFIIAIFMNFKEAYAAGDAETAVKSLESAMFGMLIILLFCVIPFTGSETPFADLKYSMRSPMCVTDAGGDRVPASEDGEADELESTVFGESLDLGADIVTDVDGEPTLSVYQPLAWHLVNLFSTGLTNSVIGSMNCVNNYQALLLRIQQVTIEDEQLRELTSIFTRECYSKAVAEYDANRTPSRDGLDRVEDVDWIGSKVFLETEDRFYNNPDHYVREMLEFGFPRDDNRPSDIANGGAESYPTCIDVWYGPLENWRRFVPLLADRDTSVGLRGRLLDSVRDIGDLRDDWDSWGYNVFVPAGAPEPSDDVIDDMLVRMISQTTLKPTGGVPVSQLGFTQDFGIESEGMRAVIESVGTYLTASLESLDNGLTRLALQTSGPIVIALIQMLIIMVSPFVMIMGHYRFDSFMQLALAYFTFEFMNAIFAMAFWIDQRLVGIFYSHSTSFFDQFSATFHIIAATSLLSMVLLPTIWLAIMATGGARLVRGMGTGGVGGGSAPGSGMAKWLVGAALFKGFPVGKIAKAASSAAAKAVQGAVKGIQKAASVAAGKK